MYKKFAWPHFSIVIFFSFFFGVSGWGASSSTISITGVVRQPLNLTLQDLQKLETVTVRLNEVTKDRHYNGAFYYRGVPLKTLLELAFIQKEETGFSKQNDLAILVRNRDGKQTVLAWGEVFFSNPSDIVIAFSSTPIIPHADCKTCHGPEVYQSRLDVLSRKVGYPKLIVANDFYTDRSLEEVTNIEVVDLHLKIKFEKTQNLFSPGFTVTGDVKQTLNISDLASYPRIEAPAKMIGDGAGYHGLESYGGVLLSEILKKAGVTPDFNEAIVISAPDGYRSLVSIGEVFLSSKGKSIMIADQVANQPVKKEGKFKLICPDDLSADRTVKAVSKIEVVSLNPKSKFYIIGVGCADTRLITLEAISAMGKADVFVCVEDLRKRFAKYIGNKPVLFDPFKTKRHQARQKPSHVDAKSDQESYTEETKRDIRMIRDALKMGKTVAFLEYGDPTIHPSWMHWLGDLAKEAHFIPGISAFNASNALIGRLIGCKGSIILTAPRGLEENEPLLKAIAANGDTMAIFVGLKELKNLTPLFQKYYASTTPVNLVYRAGYSDSEYVVKTTIAEAAEVAKKEKEQYLGMIYIGPCLE
jgi:precorrin-4 methylase/DMSO/TMAO reductase YedYZ molybdopterin-dependent catalytic subunit